MCDGDEWKEIDRELRALAVRRCALDAEEARLLAIAVQIEVWRSLGKASLHEYLEEVLGYSPRQASERVRIATALDDLPELARALAAGELHFSAVRELTRVATRTTEQAWIDDAHGKNLRQIEQAVAGRRRGDRPDDPADPDLVARPIRFDVRPATLALLRQAQQALEAERGERLDDDALISALCNAVLGGWCDDESGRAKHQIMISKCDSCAAAWQDGAGSKQPLDAADLARAECDAQRVDLARATQDVAPRVMRFVKRRDGGRCCVPGCRSSRYLEIHHVVPRESGGGHSPENLTLVCDGHHRALHQGKLSITGKAPVLEIRWATHVGRDAELALTTLGFRPHEARAAVAEAAKVVGATAPLDALVRAALQRLAP
ncbi:MAG TPA: HNH endonuclease [Kofleriaceae bacterium]|jgi:hypothetical protein